MAVPETLSLRLSYELAHIADRGEFLRVASDAVGALLPADQLGWLAVDTGDGKAEIYGTGGIDRPEIVQALARCAGAHPMLLWYQAAPEDVAPLRMSDLMAVRAWRSHQVYSEVYSSLGAVYQICVPVAPYRDRAGAGWAFNRAGHDFSDDELELVARLQPTLIALNQASCLAFGQRASVQSEARDRVGLTAREADILDLLAGGMTATAIAHVCRISPATVRKHLEHIYAKLGCSDRLLAVERARRLGLIPRVSPPKSA